MLYTHEFVLFGYEIPDKLRAELGEKFETKFGVIVPDEDRELRVTVACYEQDPIKAKMLLLKSLQ